MEQCSDTCIFRAENPDGGNVLDYVSSISPGVGEILAGRPQEIGEVANRLAALAVCVDCQRQQNGESI